MTITALPSAPSRSNPAAFSDAADTWVAALDDFTTEANALAAEVNGYASSASSSASAASGSASAASASATSASSSMSAISSAIGINFVSVSGTSQAATTGNLYVLQNASTTTVTLPVSPVAGNVIGVKVANGRIDNVINRNGQNIEGLAENLTLDNASAYVLLRYVDATSQWRIVQ